MVFLWSSLVLIITGISNLAQYILLRAVLDFFKDGIVCSLGRAWDSEHLPSAPQSEAVALPIYTMVNESCAQACVCACVRACVYACVCVRVRLHICANVRVASTCLVFACISVCHITNNTQFWYS